METRNQASLADAARKTMMSVVQTPAMQRYVYSPSFRYVLYKN